MDQNATNIKAKQNATWHRMVQGNKTEPRTFMTQPNQPTTFSLIFSLKSKRNCQKVPSLSLRVHRTPFTGSHATFHAGTSHVPHYFHLVLFPYNPATHVFSTTFVGPTIITLFFLERPEIIEENNNQRDCWILLVPTWRYLVGTITWRFYYSYPFSFLTN